MRVTSPGRLRLMARAGRTVARHAWARAASAMLSPVPRIRSTLAGDDPRAASAQAAVYVTYDAAGLVADFVVAQVAALAACGRRVVVVSHSPVLPADGVARLRPFVREIVHRRNIGHDFGAYRDGLARLGDLGRLESLILMNDSCYGPFRDLGEVERAAEASGAGVFGITDSWAHAYHVQSYYLWISASVLRSGAFAAFWHGLLLSQPRSMVISHGEICLTQAMMDAGFRAAVLCPYREVARAAHGRALAALSAPGPMPPAEHQYWEELADDLNFSVPLNPAYFFWDLLLSGFGSPFLKRDLLRRNPTASPGLLNWEAFVSPDLVPPVIDHLSKV